MPEPTYKIAQRLHERRSAVGLPKYGRHLDANSQGCMLVHALEENADETNYLIAEIQRRKHMLQKLDELIEEMQAEKAPGWAYQLEKLFDLLGGESALAQYDEILGTVAENAAVAPEPVITTHKWSNRMSRGNLEFCEVCGIVRRADDKNKPCRAMAELPEAHEAPDPRGEAMRVAEEALESCKWNVTNHSEGHQMQFQLCAEKARQALAAIRAAGGAR